MKKLKEQINGNAAMVFHGSKDEEVYKYVCEGKWKRSNGVYGDGIYTVYNLNGTNTENGGYGNYIMKLYIKDLSNYWCFNWDSFQKVHPLWAKHTNEDDFIDYQAEKFKLEQDDYPVDLGLFYGNYTTYYEFLETVDGIIYHGEHDGDCILSYNPYNCRPVAISDDFGTTWKKIDEEYVQQYKQTLSNPKVNKSNYKNNTNFINVTIPDNVTEIKSKEFRSDKSLRSIIIPDSVTEIGEYAFSNCHNLQYVKIPNSITELKSNVFENCKHLNHITIPDSVTEIGEYAFAECTSLTNITIPDSVTYIGGNAFAECTSLTNITIPDSVTYIGGNAFQSCTGLTNIIIPDSVTSIGNSAFSFCTGLTNIIIPDSVTSIGNSAFSFCTRLTNINIPNSVTSIGNNAFYNCRELTEITIPKSITYIGTYAFYGCSRLTEINYEGTKAEWNRITKDIGWNGIVNFNA